MNHSRRYQEIKKKILNNKHYSLSDALDFLRNNNNEKLKAIKASFSLNWKNQKNILKTKIILPHLVKKNKRIAVIREGLPEETLKKCQNNNQVELLNLSEIRQKVEGKKTKWGFTKVIAHSDVEDLIKPLQKVLRKRFVDFILVFLILDPL